MRLLGKWLLILVSAGAVYLNSAELELVKTIGDDREEYTFFIISSAAFSKNKDIFVLDGQGVFVAKYDWKGNFLKKTGRSGQGPKEFYFARSLAIYGNRLYILDRGNHRIVEMDLDLSDLNYFKLKGNAMLDGTFLVLEKRRFLGEFWTLRENRDKIGIIDSNGNVLKSFFNQYPIELDGDYFNRSKMDNSKMARLVILTKETAPVIGRDEKNERILVSFKKPDNPVQFFVYTTGGKLIKKFSYTIRETKYKFSDFYITASAMEIMNPEKYPAKTFSPYIYSLFIHKDHFIVFLWLQDYLKKDIIKNRAFCLIFDRHGKLVQKLPVENKMRFFCIIEEGYLLGSKSDEDITRLYIYKLKL